MKHLLRSVVALGILAVPAAAGAQETHGGVRAGLNLASLALSPDLPSQVDKENRLGLVVGLFGVVPISDQVAFQPEALYSQQGVKFSGQGMTVTTKFDYFQVPLLGRFRVGKGSPVAVLAGPSLGVRTRVEFDVPGVPDEFSEAFEDDVKRFDFGLVAGAAADIGRWLVLDGRYTWGLTNIAKSGTSDTNDNGSGKHRVLSLSAGVRF